MASDMLNVFLLIAEQNTLIMLLLRVKCNDWNVGFRQYLPTYLHAYSYSSTKSLLNLRA